MKPDPRTTSEGEADARGQVLHLHDAPANVSEPDPVRECDPSPEPFTVGLIEAEQRTGMSRHYWRKLAYKGELRHLKVGRRMLLFWEDIKNHLLKHVKEMPLTPEREEA